MSSDDYEVITVRLKDKPWITKSFIKKYMKDQFDEDTMEIVPKVNKSKEEEKKYYGELREHYKVTGGPAIVISGRNATGVTYNGKLDSGATENLLDMGLEKAKKRALERNKKYGSSFRKVKRRIRGRKKK